MHYAINKWASNLLLMKKSVILSMKLLYKLKGQLCTGPSWNALLWIISHAPFRVQEVSGWPGLLRARGLVPTTSMAPPVSLSCLSLFPLPSFWTAALESIFEVLAPSRCHFTSSTLPTPSPQPAKISFVLVICYKTVWFPRLTERDKPRAAPHCF